MNSVKKAVNHYDRDHLNLLRYMESKGANLFHKNNNGDTILHEGTVHIRYTNISIAYNY